VGPGWLNELGSWIRSKVYILVFCVTFCRSLYCLSFFINGVMVSVLASSVVDRGFEPRSGQTKDCFVLNQHAELDFYSASSLKQQSAD
jgi:hypothetical protein